MMKLCALPQTQIMCGNKLLDLSQPQIMGILNVTPDSFSDGGKYANIDLAIQQALLMVQEGASIIDIGGESTRPGAAEVTVEEELKRILPVVQELSKHDVILSIDTSEPRVIEKAVHAGAHIWNDVRALTRPHALSMAVKLNIPVILMHMRGEPTTMNQLATYTDIVKDVINELSLRVEHALKAGIQPHQIIIDPGFGFAKNTQQNLELLNQLWKFNALGYPILSGLSRKRFIGEITVEKNSNERVIGSVIGHMLSIQQGASIVRAHDVKEMKQALDMWLSIQK